MTPASSQSCSASQAGSLVHDLVEEISTKLQRGETVDIEEYVRAHPDCAERLRGVLPTLQVLAELGFSAADGATADPAAEGSSAALRGVLGDYRILREIGRGGMGVVYEAEQLSLGRRVALKVLPLAASLDAKHLHRFKIEAHAAAQLHHTNIVPVHAVGQDRGVHFYAMQYIEGRSLAAVVQELRGRQGLETLSSRDAAPVLESNIVPTGGKPAQLGPQVPEVNAADRATIPLLDAGTFLSRPQEISYERAIARLFVQAAEAIHCAHDQDVIHRDIKPGNLLLDDRGKLWITDFGLALVPGDAGLTMTGDVLGTLRYMSPEQALGPKERIDQRTDVYSLGVTLFELLALEPAYPGNDRQEILRRIAADDVPHFPSRCTTVPAELQTIVAKATAKLPAERYPTALALAKDLQCWLDDRPIEARRPGLTQKTRKWMRRHRRVLGVVAVTLVVGTLAGLAASAAFIWQAYREQSRLRLLAEEDETWARDVVDELCVRGAERVLFYEPHMTPERERLLSRALAFYKHLVERCPEDAQTRYKFSVMLFRFGRMQARLGRLDLARQFHEDQLVILEDLIRRDPTHKEYRFDAHGAHVHIHFSLSGSTSERERHLLRAWEILKDLVAEHPGDGELEDALAGLAGEMGDFFAACERNADAEFYFREGLKHARELVRQHPDRFLYQKQVGLNLTGLGKLLWNNERRPEGEAALRGALPIQTELVRLFPDTRDYQVDLAAQQFTLGGCLLDSGRVAEGERLLRAALAAQEKMAADFEHDCAYRALPALTLSRLAEHAQVQGHPQEALDIYRKLRRLLNNLIKDCPHDVHHAREAALLLANCPLEELRDPQAALAIAQELITRSPDALSLWALAGIARYRMKDLIGARQALEKASTLHGSGGVVVAFFLAMTYAQLEETQAAREWLARGEKALKALPRRDLAFEQARSEAATLVAAANSGSGKGRTIRPQNPSQKE